MLLVRKNSVYLLYEMVLRCQESTLRFTVKVRTTGSQLCGQSVIEAQAHWAMSSPSFLSLFVLYGFLLFARVIRLFRRQFLAICHYARVEYLQKL